jgi:AcrR family transcriptional regulator
MTTQKENILQAARKLFTKQGFAGTSINKIAQEAGVTKSLVFHHFENKEKLWLRVKEQIVIESKQKFNNLPSTELTWPNFIKELIKRNFRFYKENPDISRMIGWQRLEEESQLEIGITKSKHAQEWLDAFAHYQQQGDINPNTPPGFFVSMVLAIVSAAALDPNVFIKGVKQEKAYLEFCIKQLEQAFKH